MKPLRNLVVALLLTVWICPTLAHAAQPLTGGGGPAAPAESSRSPATAALSPSALLALGASESQGTTPAADQQETEALAAREQAAPALQDYRGGGAYIYIGSGATLILVLVLLILLL